MWAYFIAGLMVISGAFGFGNAICLDLKNEIYNLKIQRKILFGIEREIVYLHRTMEEIFEIVSLKIERPYDHFLMSVSEQMKMRNGEGLWELWGKNIDILKAQVNCSKKVIDNLQQIGKVLGYEDDKAQIGAIKILQSEMDKMIEELEIQRSQKEKLIKTLSLLSGVFLLILFI
ncbi:MAG: stage III sporulation protein AB [Lachnospiraceae bacterium]|nr:stage III sporulation protein AB [Lachnospiraceae bacterium]